MSQAMSAAAPLRANIRLEQAISAFEADLPFDQKTAFQKQRLNATRSRPTTQDVMCLTAELDSRFNRSKLCFGARFTSVLQAVQKFASIGDILVGGSQNLIACGVWSVVRMLILAIPNTVSIIERVSNMFMVVGQSVPRYQKLAALFPHSGNLQNQLCEYNLVLVELCHTLMKQFNKSKLERLVTSISEADLIKYQSRLQQWAVSVQDEVQFLIAQGIERDATANSKFRDISIRFSSTSMRNEELRIKARALAACSNYDYEAAWKRLRKMGQATIHKLDAEYRAWYDDPSCSTLVVSGILGSGKSVLLANVVDDVSLGLAQNKPIVTYFFCESDVPESLNSQTIVGSLLRQVLNALPDSAALDKIFHNMFETSIISRGTNDLADLSVRLIPNDQHLYIILDGIQNCSEKDYQDLVNVLRRLQDLLKVHLCLSRRSDGRDFMVNTAVHKLVIPEEDNPDIKQFIQTELETSIENGTLVLGQPRLILEIRDVLVNGAKGMFLWVVLQLEALYQAKTDAAILHALKNLPETLAETFMRILESLQASSYGTLKQALFNLIIAAIRPLDLEELREASSVDPGNSNWDPTQLINNIRAVISSFGGLLTIDEEYSTVRFVHPSVRQFLIPISDHREENLKAQVFMCDVVVTYLSYAKFRGHQPKLGLLIDAIDAPFNFANTAMSSTAGKNLALDLLRQIEVPDSDTRKSFPDSERRSIDVSRFWNYAHEYLRSHAWVYIVNDLSITSSLRHRILPNMEMPSNPLKIEWLMVEISQIEWDSQEGLRWLITITRPGFVLSRPSPSGNSLESFSLHDSRFIVDRVGHTPWDWAIQFSYTDVLHRFFKYPGNGDQNILRIEALFELLRWDFLELAEELLSLYKWELDAQIEFPLEELARCFNIHSQEHISILPLVVVFSTIPRRHEAVLLLLKHGADPCLDNSMWQSAFFYALARQHWDIAGAFVAAGADLDHTLADKRTMLMRLCCPVIRPKAIAWLVQHGALTSVIDQKGHGLLWNGGRHIPALVALLRCVGIAQDDPIWLTLPQYCDSAEQLLLNDLQAIANAKLKGAISWTKLPDLSVSFATEIMAPGFGRNDTPFGRKSDPVPWRWYEGSQEYVKEQLAIQGSVYRIFEDLCESDIGPFSFPAFSPFGNL